MREELSAIERARKRLGNYRFVRESEKPSGLGIAIQSLDDELDHATRGKANAAKTRTLVAEGFETGVVLIHDLRRREGRAGREPEISDAGHQSPRLNGSATFI